MTIPMNRSSATRAQQMGYQLRWDGSTWCGHDDGRPFSLGWLWREFYGCGGVTILAPDGRVVLRDAGAVSSRAHEVHSRYDDQRVARRTRRYLAMTKPSTEA